MVINRSLRILVVPRRCKKNIQPQVYSIYGRNGKNGFREIKIDDTYSHASAPSSSFSSLYVREGDVAEKCHAVMLGQLRVRLGGKPESRIWSNSRLSLALFLLTFDVIR